MSNRIRTAATLTKNDKFELFNVQYRIVETPQANDFGGVAIWFQVDEQTNTVHMSSLVVPPTTPFVIL